jgi:hypothetical protein
MTYGMESIGEALPGLLMDGGLAALSGGTALPAIAAKRTAGAAIGKLVAGRMATGAAVSSGLQSGGAMEAELEAQGSENNPYAPVAAGGVTALMTKLPVGVVLDRVLGVLDEKAAKTVGERVIKAFKTAGVGAGIEAPTSAVESLSNQLISQIALNKEKVEMDIGQVVDETLRGVIGGGAFGATGQAMAEGVDASYRHAKKRLKDFGDGYEKNEDGTDKTVDV